MLSRRPGRALPQGPENVEEMGGNVPWPSGALRAILRAPGHQRPVRDGRVRWSSKWTAPAPASSMTEDVEYVELHVEARWPRECSMTEEAEYR